MRAFSGDHVRPGAQLAAMGHLPGGGQGFLQRQGGQGRLACAQEAPGLQVRQRIEQRMVHGALLLLLAPAPGLARQLREHRQSAQRRMAQHEGSDQQ
ncbi:hypothetical protein D3C71_1987930 [compost metagenome]